MSEAADGQPTQSKNRSNRRNHHSHQQPVNDGGDHANPESAVAHARLCDRIPGRRWIACACSRRNRRKRGSRIRARSRRSRRVDRSAAASTELSARIIGRSALIAKERSTHCGQYRRFAADCKEAPALDRYHVERKKKPHQVGPFRSRSIPSASDPHRHHNIPVLVVFAFGGTELTGGLCIFQLQFHFSRTHGLDEIEQILRVESDRHAIARVGDFNRILRLARLGRRCRQLEFIFFQANADRRERSSANCATREIALPRTPLCNRIDLVISFGSTAS